MPSGWPGRIPCGPDARTLPEGADARLIPTATGARPELRSGDALDPTGAWGAVLHRLGALGLTRVALHTVLTNPARPAPPGPAPARPCDGGGHAPGAAAARP